MANRNIELQAIIESITEGLETKTAQQLKRFAVRAKSPIGRNEVRAMHNELAAEAKGAVASGYAESGFRHGNNYRSVGMHRRYSGAMGEAIAGDLIVSVGPNTMNFVDLKGLKRFAPHWRRLNFGAAGPKGDETKNVAIKPMRFDRFGLERKSSPLKLSFRDTKPSKAFSIPRGYWSTSQFSISVSDPSAYSPKMGAGSKVDNFYLAPKLWAPKSNPTKGIRGGRFIDKGLSYVNQHYPQRLTNLAESKITDDMLKAGFKVTQSG